MSNLSSVIKPLFPSITAFTKHASGLKLRAYQVEVAQAICDSVIHQRGLTFVVMFPRQSGKNELQAQIETYLLMLFSQLNAEIVKVSPTWRPQTINAMRRLERVLKRNLLTRNAWKKKAGYIYEIGSANIYFFSGGRNANIVGATASTLLEVDEAQDVSIPKFDKDIAPMAASTNATRVFWGTAWTSRTLLARELAAAQVTEQRDGIKRVFILTADQVAADFQPLRAGDIKRTEVAVLGAPIAAVDHVDQGSQSQHVGKQDELAALRRRYLSGAIEKRHRRPPFFMGEPNLLGKSVQMRRQFRQHQLQARTRGLFTVSNECVRDRILVDRFHDGSSRSGRGSIREKRSLR